MKKFPAIILIITVLLCATYSIAEGTCLSPKVWTVGSLSTADFHSIHEAITTAQPGDIINVLSGTYYEHLIVNKPLSLIGQNKETTIIDGAGVDPGDIILISANNVVISGFTIQHARAGGDAIRVDGYNGTIVSNNIIANNGDGIRILHSNQTEITNNIVKNNPNTAVGFDWTRNNNVSSNILSSNNIAIGVGGTSFDSIFYNNTISQNIYGFYVDIQNSTFYDNTLVSNNVQAQFYNSTDTNRWDNGSIVGGNYWSDYTGRDLNGDGIGETPYVINSNNIDNFPKVSPVFLLPSPTPTATSTAMPTATASPMPSLPTATPVYTKPPTQSSTECPSQTPAQTSQPTRTPMPTLLPSPTKNSASLNPDNSFGFLISPPMFMLYLLVAFTIFIVKAPSLRLISKDKLRLKNLELAGFSLYLILIGVIAELFFPYQFFGLLSILLGVFFFAIPYYYSLKSDVSKMNIFAIFAAILITAGLILPFNPLSYYWLYQLLSYNNVLFVTGTILSVVTFLIPQGQNEVPIKNNRKCPKCDFTVKDISSDYCPHCGQTLPKVASKIVKSTKLRFVGATLLTGGTLALIVNQGIPVSTWSILLIFLLFFVLSMSTLKRRHFWSLVVSWIVVVNDLLFFLIVEGQFQYFSETNNWGTTYGYYLNNLILTLVFFIISIPGPIILAVAKGEFKD